MSTVSYDAFFPFLRPLVPNASVPLMILALRSTCIDFCTETLYFQDSIEPISTIVGESEYDIDVPQDYDLNIIMALYYKGIRIYPVSKLTLSHTLIDLTATNGTPRYYLSLRTPSVSLVPPPDENVTNAITGSMSLIPSRTSEIVNADLFSDHAEDIAFGAAAVLMRIPNQPFTNLAAADVIGKTYNIAKGKRKKQVNAGNVLAPLIVNLRRGW